MKMQKTRKTTRTLAALLMVVLLATILAACGDTATPSTTTSAATSASNNTTSSAATTAPAAQSNGQKVTVTYMTWENNDTNAALDKAMQTFMQKNPDINVQRIPSPNSDYGQKLNSLVQAKQLPDVVWSGNDTEQQFGAEGILYDWSSQANASKNDSFDISKFAPDSLDNWKIGDKLYGLPTLMNTYGIWYNADAFQKASLQAPTNSWKWEDLYADAKALTSKDGGTTNYGLWAGDLDSTGSGPFFMSNCSVSAGGQPFEDKINNPTKVTADASFVNCVKMMAQAVQGGYVTPPGFQPSGSANVDTTSLFASGKIPMLFGGQWLAPSFMKANPSFKYGFAPLPTVNTQVQPYDAVGIISPKTIKNPDAVWKVSQFLASGAWETTLVNAPVAPAAYVPSSTPYFNTLKSAGLTSVADSVNYELQSPTKEGIRFTATWASKANDVLSKWTDIMQGKTPVDSGMNDMVSQLNSLIQSNS